MKNEVLHVHYSKVTKQRSNVYLQLWNDVCLRNINPRIDYGHHVFLGVSPIFVLDVNKLSLINPSLMCRIVLNININTSIKIDRVK